MTALDTRPADLRLAARTLRDTAADFSQLSQRLLAAQSASAGTWVGLAGLGQQRATERVAAVVQARCGPAEQVATALAGFADQAEHAQAVVRAAQQARGEAVTERGRQIDLLSTVTDPPEIAAIKTRITTLDRTIRQQDDEVSFAEELLDQGRRGLERVVHDSWIDFDDLLDLVQLGKDAAPIVRGGGLVITAARVALTMTRLGRDLNPFRQFTLEARLAKLLTAMRKPPLVLALTRLPFRILIPLSVIPVAIGDIRTAGGYEGIQAVTLRVTAAAAIPASIAMVLPHPPTAAIGAGVVGIYLLAKGGFAVWDQRLLLAQVGKSIYRERHKIIEVAKKVLMPTPGMPLGSLGPMTPLPGVRDVLDDLPWVRDLGRWVPALGGPIAVPGVPIQAGPRLPAVPPPGLNPIGAGILLPTLRKLF